MRIFLALAAAGLTVLAGRLVQLQLLRADVYRDQARQLVRDMTFPDPARGRILDRKGAYLAVNRPTYSLCLQYGLLSGDEGWRDDLEARWVRRGEADNADRARELFERRAEATWRLAEALAAERGVDLDANIAAILDRVGRIRASVGVPVAEESMAHPVVGDILSPVDITDTVGVEIQPGTTRRYPQDDIACHVIGRVGRVSRRHMLTHNLRGDQAGPIERRRHNYRGDDMIGVAGAERMCEAQLRGRRGYRRIMRLSGGPTVVDEIPPEPGQDIRLTIDVDLQRDLTDLLRTMMPGYHGAIVVLDVPNSEVLALVSVPTYDLNTATANYADLLADEIDLPLQHRAVAARYPPGSAAKPLAALGGLTDGVIDRETIFTCRGYLHTPDAFRCWIHQYGVGHSDLNVVGAMKHSCNVFLYNVGEQMGVHRLRWWYEQFGFCDKPGSHLPEETRGQAASSGRDAVARMMAIGQGPVSATPLHVANAMATIARRGEFLSPMVAWDDPRPTVRRRVPVDPDALDLIIEGMFQVVNSPGGTAYKAFYGGEAFEPFEPLSVLVCGKTGTAEAAPQRIDTNDNGRIDAEDRIVRDGDMAWFGGFAPRERPRIAFAVVVEYVTEGGGASIAAPIAREVIRRCAERGYVGGGP